MQPVATIIVAICGDILLCGSDFARFVITIANLSYCDTSRGVGYTKRHVCKAVFIQIITLKAGVPIHLMILV